MTNRIEIEHRDKFIPQNLPLEFNILTFLAPCDPQLAHPTRFVLSVKKKPSEPDLPISLVVMGNEIDSMASRIALADCRGVGCKGGPVWIRNSFVFFFSVVLFSCVDKNSCER